MSETVAQPDYEPAPPVDMLDDLVGPSPLDRREAVIAEVAATRLEELREDGLEIPPADEEPLPPEDGEGTEPTREPLPGEPLYTVKVDGQERQVPLSELTASYQSQGAARYRLDQANEVLRQARQMEQGVLERAAAPDAAAAAQPTTEQPADGLSNIDFGDLAEKLQYGDREAAAAALKETVTQIVNMGGGAPAGPTATPEQIEMRVLERVEWITALNRFGEEYPDILKDQYVGNVAGTAVRTGISSRKRATRHGNG